MMSTTRGGERTGLGFAHRSQLSRLSSDASRFPVLGLMKKLLTQCVIWFSMVGLVRAASLRQGDLSASAVSTLAYRAAMHDVGRIRVTVTNNGVIGDAFGFSSVDCFTGEPTVACDYPKRSRNMYLYGASLMVGAVVGSDTLVSTGYDGWSVAGYEFHPDGNPLGSLYYRSTIASDPACRIDAVSEQDLVATYYDTCLHCVGVSNDEVDNRPHQPLGLKVVQRSYAWSYPFAEDFVLFDFSIQNIGTQVLSNVFVGLQVDADVHYAPFYQSALDDVTGSLRTRPVLGGSPGCDSPDSMLLCWIADNDGDLESDVTRPVPHVIAVDLIRKPSMTSSLSYNWWTSISQTVYDYGPQARATYRPLVSGGYGRPLGDREKYHFMSNGEVDFDQVRSAVLPTDDLIWPPLPARLDYVAVSGDAKFILSAGPGELEPGGVLPLSLSFVIGENLHRKASNFNNLPSDPDTYLANLDFSDLVANASAARRIVDNPGIDTDGDGYRGTFSLCDGDTVWLTGDGVPDWRAGIAPTAPRGRVEPLQASIRIRWNGFRSETDPDVISGEADFEGYHLYLSSTGETGSFVRVGSYDVEDFFRYRWDFGLSDWSLIAEQLTLEVARSRYAPEGCAATWHPLNYSRSAPYVWPSHPDSIFYFIPIMANASAFGWETPFVKSYPSAPRPVYSTPSAVPADSVSVYLTDEGYFKYYEYECLITDLIPQHQYSVAVTAFDYGSPSSTAVSLESDLPATVVRVRPLYGAGCCAGQVGNVVCDNDDIVSIADVAALIDYLFISGTPPCCWAEADINLSGGNAPGAGDITLGDVALLIDHLFVNREALGECR
jgi:hypothetical protein